jgi:hypothetical protein
LDRSEGPESGLRFLLLKAFFGQNAPSMNINSIKIQERKTKYKKERGFSGHGAWFLTHTLLECTFTFDYIMRSVFYQSFSGLVEY